MASNVVSLDENRPHVAGPVVCTRCEHSWVAVRPVGVIFLECPKCGAHRGTSFMMMLAAADQTLATNAADRWTGVACCARPAFVGQLCV